MSTRDELLALDLAHSWHPYTPMDHWSAQDPMVFARAEGPWLYDADGRRYLDALSSWWVASLGHRHPRLCAALASQLGTLAHVSYSDGTHEPAARLGAELCALAPGALPREGEPWLGPRLERVFFTDNGSGSVEVALTVAAQYFAQNGQPERRRFLALSGAFHGETAGARSLGGDLTFRKGLGALLFEPVRLPSPAEEGGWEHAFARASEVLEARGHEVAAVVVEPVVQGVAGMQVYDPAYLRALREQCTRAGALLIADEVFTGLGRTGTLFACEQAGVVPDLLCLAKGLSGGLLPFGATLASGALFEGFRGERGRALLYGHSYCGNPLGCAVAREVLAVLREERVLEQMAPRAESLARCFRALPERFGERVIRPRARGMVAAVDLGEGGYLGARGWELAREAAKRGVYVRPLGDTVYVVPPLNLGDSELALLLGVLEESLAVVLG